MVTYDYIKLIENDTNFLVLLRKGVIPLIVLDYKCYYESYLNELKKVSKTQAITNVAEDYNKSERTIRRAIKFMSN